MHCTTCFLILKFCLRFAKHTKMTFSFAVFPPQVFVHDSYSAYFSFLRKILLESWEARSLTYRYYIYILCMCVFVLSYLFNIVLFYFFMFKHKDIELCTEDSVEAFDFNLSVQIVVNYCVLMNTKSAGINCFRWKMLCWHILSPARQARC